MSEHLISIIIPAYNTQHYICDAVNSILKQKNYSNFEIIIVDDHSTDDTYKVIQNLAHQDSRVFIMKNSRCKGAAGARNTGIEQAKGEWISFLDSDDLWDDHMLEEHQKALNKYPSSQFITSDCYILNENKNNKTRQSEINLTWKKYFQEANKKNIHLKINNPIEIFINEGNITYTGAFFIKNKLLHDVGLFNESFLLSEDTMLWIKSMNIIPYLVYIPKPLMTYQLREGSLTRRGEPGTTYKAIGLKELLLDSDFKSHHFIIKKQLLKCTFNNIYYYRKNGLKIKAITSSLDAVCQDLKNVKSWRNLLASMLFI